MKMELYDSAFNFLGDAEVTEVGGYAMIDLDGGTIVPDAMYYVKVMADDTEQRVQIYELVLRNDLSFAFPLGRLYEYQKLKLGPWLYEAPALGLGHSPVEGLV